MDIVRVDWKGGWKVESMGYKMVVLMVVQWAAKLVDLKAD